MNRGYTLKVGPDTYTFNICEKLHLPCLNGKPDACTVKDQEKSCEVMVNYAQGVITEDKNQAILSVKPNDKLPGMNLTFVCNNEGSMSDEPTIAGSYGAAGLIANVTSKRSCASFSLTYIYQKYAYIFSTVFIIAGLVIAFFGVRLFKITLFIISTFFITAVLVLLIYQLIMTSHTAQYAFWLVLGVSGLIGLTGAYFISRYDKACFFMAGAALGAVLGFFIYGLAMASWAPPVQGEFRA